jgi:hypothetical protein
MAEPIDTYTDLRIGVVGAAAIAVAERLGTNDVATLDHRSFTVARPRHTEAFTVFPWYSPDPSFLCFEQYEWGHRRAQGTLPLGTAAIPCDQTASSMSVSAEVRCAASYPWRK